MTESSLLQCICKYDEFCTEISAPQSKNIWATDTTWYDFDDQCTLKGDERQRRRQSEKEPSQSDSLEIPNQKELMKNPKKKAQLLNHIANLMSKHLKILPPSMAFILGGMMEESGK